MKNIINKTDIDNIDKFKYKANTEDCTFTYDF